MTTLRLREETLSDVVVVMDEHNPRRNLSREEGEGWMRSIRASGRAATGVSLSAIRASGRAVTGISLTATRTFCRTATGVSVTTVLKTIVAAFPLWVRYFMQPFLILYYTPFVVVRSIVESRGDARKTHEHFVEAIREAVHVAGKVNESGDWPVYVDDDGSIRMKDSPPGPVVSTAYSEETPDLIDCIVESVQVAAAATVTVIQDDDAL